MEQWNQTINNLPKIIFVQESEKPEMENIEEQEIKNTPDTPITRPRIQTLE